MKRRLFFFAWILTCAAILTGCATGQVALFPQRPAGVDQDVVESFVCRGEIAEAEHYQELRGASLAERTERIERARRAVAHRQGCCDGTRCAAAPPESAK